MHNTDGASMLHSIHASTLCMRSLVMNNNKIVKLHVPRGVHSTIEIAKNDFMT